MVNEYSKKEINKRLFNLDSNLRPLTKDNLQYFIDNYPTDYSTHYRDKCYVDGIKDVLGDLEATFLWKLKVREIDIESLDKNTKESLLRGIKQSKRGELHTLDLEDSTKYKEYLQSISEPGYPNL